MRGVRASGLVAGLLTTLGAFAAPGAARGQGAVGFQPVVGSLPDGVQLNAIPAVSADRRYVRLSLNVGFQTIDGFSTFPVPAAVGGGGVNRGALGGSGLGGLLGGGGGAGGGGAGAGGAGGAGNAGAVGVVSGMNGVIDSAPAPGPNPQRWAAPDPGYGPMGSGPAPTGYDPFLKDMAMARPVAPPARRARAARPKPVPTRKPAVAKANPAPQAKKAAAQAAAPATKASGG